MRSPLLLTSLLWLLFASAALAAEPAVVEGAKKEGALVFYTTMDIQNSKPLLDAFIKKYPFIKGDLVRLGGTAMVSRIMTEAQASANRFDVAVGISPSYTPMRERNLIAAYLSPEFPNLYDDLYDAKGTGRRFISKLWCWVTTPKLFPVTICRRPTRACSNHNSNKNL